MVHDIDAACLFFTRAPQTQLHALIQISTLWFTSYHKVLLPGLLSLERVGYKPWARKPSFDVLPGTM
jgi:hypothetical protein